MFKRIAVMAVLLALCVSCTMWNKTASGWSGATGGERLEKLFWDDVAANNVKSLDQHLSATLVASGPGGPQDRAAFLHQLQAYALKSVTLRDCTSHLNGADVMIACVVQRQPANGPAVTVNTLSVWQQLQKGWVMVAHAESPLPASGD